MFNFLYLEQITKEQHKFVDFLKEKRAEKTNRHSPLG